MIKHLTLCLTITLLAFTFSATTPFAKGKSSPFLITDGLPHLTKLLMQQWDNPQLQLSESQKTKLMVIRTETISGVRSLGPRVGALQQEVIDGIKKGKTPGDLKDTVNKLAALKAEATMLHLQCIHKTNAILDPEQTAILTGK